MPMHSWARLGLAVPVFAVALGLSGSLASRFPVGSYDSDAYTLTFDSTGAFRYRQGDRLMVQGEYVVHDSTVSLTDEKGSDACVGRAGTQAHIAGTWWVAPCGSTPFTIPARIGSAGWLIKRGSHTAPARPQGGLTLPVRPA